jgi:hypothetical protein
MMLLWFVVIPLCYGLVLLAQDVLNNWACPWA